MKSFMNKVSILIVLLASLPIFADDNIKEHPGIKKYYCFESLLSTDSKRTMWWQGTNAGSPKHHGFSLLKVDGASSEGRANFKGVISAGNSTYKALNPESRQMSHLLLYTKFDRPGNTGSESWISGEGVCGPKGSLGTFNYEGSTYDGDLLYSFNFYIKK